MPALPEEGAKGFPEVAAPAGWAAAWQGLLAAGLVAPYAVADGGEARFAVHRWTAGKLAAVAEADELAEAHRRSALFWRWRVEAWPQDRGRDMLDLLEARHHHHAAGELEEAVRVTEWVCLQFQTWGAYRRQEQLMEETLSWLPEGSPKAASFTGQLGTLALLRSSYNEALDWYDKALAIFEELGDRLGIATFYHQLGRVAQARGSYDEALDWYKKSLAIKKELGDRARMATSYHQLGRVAQERGSYDEALDWYKMSLAIFGELGEREGMASSYQNLGIVAQARGSYDEALDWYRKSLAIFEEQGNRARMAASYHNLGRLAQARGSYDEALAWYRKSLAIFEELGNRAGMATTTSNLGALAAERGAPEDAVPLILRGLALGLEIGSPEADISLHWLGRLRQLLGAARFAEILARHLDEENAVAVLSMLDQQPPPADPSPESGS